MSAEGSLEKQQQTDIRWGRKAKLPAESKERFLMVTEAIKDVSMFIFYLFERDRE